MTIRAICAAAASALLLAGCGGSSKAGSKKTGPYGPRNSPYALSKCMRENGLSHFPDPSQGPGGGGVGFPGGLLVTSTGEIVVDGIPFGGPALKRASTACKTYLPPGGPAPSLSAAEQRQALQLAECMRAHGVPNFADPGPGLGGGQAKQVPLPGADSPAFKHAVSICGRGRLQIRAGNLAGP